MARCWRPWQMWTSTAWLKVYLRLLFFLQNVVSRSAIQFKGNSQHDAQEFLLWLLDRVHEDLNHIVHPDIRPQKVSGDWQHTYLQYFIFTWAVLDVVTWQSTFSASSRRTKCPWRITITSTRLFCTGVVSGTIQVITTLYSLLSTCLFDEILCVIISLIITTVNLWTMTHSCYGEFEIKDQSSGWMDIFYTSTQILQYSVAGKDAAFVVNVKVVLCPTIKHSKKVIQKTDCVNNLSSRKILFQLNAPSISF